MMRFQISFAVGTLTVFLIAAAQPAVSADMAFHPASTDAELALDRVLKTADGDRRIPDNLFHRAPVPAALRVVYARLLTPAFLASLRQQERALVQKDCGGVYRSGEICGFDYNPITCAQDVASSFAYETLRDTGKTAIIGWQGNTYMLMHERGAWKLARVSCAH